MVTNPRASNSSEPLLPLDKNGPHKKTVSQTLREMKERTTQQELWSLNLATEPWESVPQPLSPSILSFSATSPIGQAQQEGRAQGCGPSSQVSLPGHRQGKRYKNKQRILTKLLKVF